MTRRHQPPPPPRRKRRPLEDTAEGLLLCPVSKKRSYSTESKANKVVTAAADSVGTTPVRAYLCPECSMWHLTSSNVTEWAKDRKTSLVSAVGWPTEDWVPHKRIRRLFAPRPGSWRPNSRLSADKYGPFVGFRLHPGRGLTAAVMILPPKNTEQIRAQAAANVFTRLQETIGAEEPFLFYWCTVPVMPSAGLAALGFQPVGDWRAVISQ